MNIRKNVYQLPAGDTTLEWYAKAVIEMKKRPSTDPTSWNYQAAMHGYNANPRYWNGAAPLPSTNEQKEFWNQCQHQSFFFLPWHRMYLAYFEQIVAKTIVDLGGPPNWCLPFWDYSDIANDPNALAIPKAFTTPDNLANGLWAERFSNTVSANYVTLEALDIRPFIGTSVDVAAGGFGGPETLFSHHNRYNGWLEEKPHNLVHMDIGGAMGSSGTAGLDPIFWVHHANIDRLWQVWLNKGGRVNPTKFSWLDYEFVFHNKDRNRVEMKCSEVVDTRNVLSGYIYEGISPVPPVMEDAQMLEQIDFTMPLEVVAATNKQFSLTSYKTTVPLKLTPPRKKKIDFEVANDISSTPKTTILKFENVKGKGAPPIQDIYLNVPEGNDDKQSYYAGSISLFGIEDASKANLYHAGNGQNYVLNVTELVNKLKALPNWNEKQLDVSIEPARPMDEASSVKIGRISLYSE